MFGLSLSSLTLYSVGGLVIFKDMDGEYSNGDGSFKLTFFLFLFSAIMYMMRALLLFSCSAVNRMRAMRESRLPMARRRY